MTKFNYFYVVVIFTSLLMTYTPLSRAGMEQPDNGNPVGENNHSTPVTRADGSLQPLSYGEKIGDKALIGFTNLISSPLEIPKNIINTMNKSNFFYGVVGGFFKGLVNTAGRIGCGIADLLTFPLPTEPIAHPLYIWDDFDMDTTYGGVMRLDKTKKTDQPVIQTPVPLPTPTAVTTPLKAVVVDRSNQCHQKTGYAV